MRAGRIEQLGIAGRPCSTRPANRFVAGFMGDADFLPVRRDGDRAVTEVGELDVSSSVVGSMAVVRPEEVAFEVEPDGPAQVVDVEFRGPSWHYTLRLDSGTVLRSSRARQTPVEIGTRVRPLLAAGHRPVLIADDA